MSVEEFRDIAFGWAILLVFLMLFWYATLRRLSVILQERLGARLKASVSTLPGVFLFIFRGDFHEAGDDRLAAVCKRFRQLLYCYIGAIGAYIVFLVIFRPHL